MAENTQETTTQTEEVTPTLDDLYKESGIEASQTQTQAQTQVQTQVQTERKADIPDPFDLENFRSYMGRQAEDTSALKQSIQTLQSTLNAERQANYVKTVEAEIQQASEYVAKESGIENVNLATFELNERARTDAKFKALWDGRNSSPQAKGAFTKALGVIAKEIDKKYAVKTDPTLVAQKKALAAARTSSATTEQNDSGEPDWGSKTGNEFTLNWERMVRGSTM